MRSVGIKIRHVGLLFQLIFQWVYNIFLNENIMTVRQYLIKACYAFCSSKQRPIDIKRLVVWPDHTTPCVLPSLVLAGKHLRYLHMFTNARIFPTAILNKYLKKAKEKYFVNFFFYKLIQDQSCIWKDLSCFFNEFNQF